MFDDENCGGGGCDKVFMWLMRITILALLAKGLLWVIVAILAVLSN